MLVIYINMLESPEGKSKFEKIYLKYRQAMFYTAKRILQDEQLAEDAVQEAFLRIINNLEKIDDNNCHKTKGFIVVVTEHIAIDMYRKRNRMKFVSMDDAEFYPYVGLLGTQQEFEGDNMVEKAILSLPVIYQGVLILKFFNEYEDKEIARLLKITQENVRQRLSRGKKKLEEILEREGIML